MPFVKGQSGNSGQSLTSKAFNTREARQFTRFCQLAAKKYGWRILDKLLKSDDLDKQRYALDVVMERGFGKPVQVNENQNWDMSEAKPMTDAELKTKAMEFINADTRRDSPGTGIPPVQ